MPTLLDCKLLMALAAAVLNVNKLDERAIGCGMLSVNLMMLYRAPEREIMKGDEILLTLN